MINRAHRFHGHGSLRGVYKYSQTVRSALISLKYTTRPSDRPYRVAVVVSRKVSKSAVVRNRIRRRMYEAVRLHETLVSPGTDLVFTVFSPEVATISDQQLTSTIGGLLKKVEK